MQTASNSDFKVFLKNVFLISISQNKNNSKVMLHGIVSYKYTGIYVVWTWFRKCLWPLTLIKPEARIQWFKWVKPLKLICCIGKKCHLEWLDVWLWSHPHLCYVCTSSSDHFRMLKWLSKLLQYGCIFARQKHWMLESTMTPGIYSTWLENDKWWL